MVSITSLFNALPELLRIYSASQPTSDASVLKITSRDVALPLSTSPGESQDRRKGLVDVNRQEPEPNVQMAARKLVALHG